MPITVYIKESPLQKISGIPSSITLDTNEPSTVFYTLDGTDPSEFSDIAIGPIAMPTNTSVVILKAFATNGVDSSPIITQKYVTDVSSARNPHDTAISRDDTLNKATYPFGSSAQASGIPPIFGNTGGIVTDDGTEPRQPTGFGPDGYAAGFIKSNESFQFKFSETNSIGESGKGIGTLPGRVIYSKPRNDNSYVTSTDASSKFFDPRAMVVFQDSRDEPFDPDIPRINRPFFDLEDHTKARDSRLLQVTDPITPQGSFLKAHYNPTDNSLTYYYYDNRVGRWVISKEPYTPSQNPTANMSGIVSRSSRGEGVGKVFKWIPFKYRVLI